MGIFDNLKKETQKKYDSIQREKTERLNAENDRQLEIERNVDTILPYLKAALKEFPSAIEEIKPPFCIDVIISGNKVGKQEYSWCIAPWKTMDGYIMVTKDDRFFQQYEGEVIKSGKKYYSTFRYDPYHWNQIKAYIQMNSEDAIRRVAHWICSYSVANETYIALGADGEKHEFRETADTIPLIRALRASNYEEAIKVFFTHSFDCNIVNNSL